MILLALTLSVTLLRCFVRLRIEARALTLSDYFVWTGWVFTLAFVICQCIALHAVLDHPLVDATYTDSVVYLKASSLKTSPVRYIEVLWANVLTSIGCVRIMLLLRYWPFPAKSFHHVLLLVAHPKWL